MREYNHASMGGISKLSQGIWVAKGAVMKRSVVRYWVYFLMDLGCESLRAHLSIACVGVCVCVFTCWTPGIIRKHSCNSC